MISVVIKVDCDYIVRAIIKNNILYIVQHILTGIFGMSAVFAE